MASKIYQSSLRFAGLLRLCLLLAVMAAMLNCFSSEKALPGIKGSGQILGKAVGPDGTGIKDVTVTTTHNGQLLTATTSSTGAFSFTLSETERGSGFNLQFAKTNFENASAAAVISLPNLKVDIGNVTMYITGSSAEVSERRITGQLLDNFSYKPIVGVNIDTTDSAGHVVTATTDANGKFTLASNYFALDSSFAVTARKSNYIERSDIVAVITAEENPVRNNPIRIYNLFKNVYVYVTDDSLGTALDGVSFSLQNSNKQQLTCTTGGPYNAQPLLVGQYCPDMAGITSPISGTLGDNAGGAKMQNDFLFVGNRYDVTLSKTTSACTNRQAGTSNCYRSKSTYVDVNGNQLDNPVPGQKVALYWDAWIHGTVSAGTGVTVKLYNASNTYITETTTNGSGQFVLDSPSIARNQQYKMTFEKTGYYSRLIGFSAPNDPALITITVSGANNAGAVNMTALPPPTHCVRGTVKNYWDTQPIDGATVAIFDGGWRTATTNSLGEFTISGNFGNTAVNAFDVEISKAGFTGETLVAKQTFKFTHSGVAACPGSPYDLDSAAVGACGATGVGPTGGASCESKLVLYPIGVYASINGGTKRFSYQIKQTYEKFLTEKTGLTISARVGALNLTSTLPQKNYNPEAFYLHFDDTPRLLPNVPEGKWSNHVPVNPLPTTCSPTVTTNCSPASNGVLTEGIGTDTRVLPWEIKTYVFYHFYAAAPGAYTVETTGSTDTHITLIAQTGAVMGSDDDGGTGSNARIGPINLLRGWYYVKVRGKNDNVFGFFDVRVTGPVAAESNYSTMLSPTATYSTDCAPNSGNLVLSWFDAGNSLLYIAAPGENGGCSATATIEKHGPVGDIVRGRFDGSLRPIAPAGANATITSSLPFRGFFNIIRSE